MTLLLVVIYIVFIALGLPDSVIGAAWPAIYPEFNQPVGNASIITVLISSGTIIASFFSAKLLNKFGTPLVTAVSVTVSAFSILGFSISNSIVWMLILALPLGLSAGAIDAALNNYVAVHFKPTHMNFLHCFYGVGVSLSPLLISFALSFNNDWRLGFRTVFYILFAISVISFLSFPLWKKATSNPLQSQKEVKPKTLPFIKMAKIPSIRIAWVVFFCTVGLEFVCGIWGCTFLVGAEGLNEATASKTITLYYVGMTLGRFISGLVSSKVKPLTVVFVGYGTVATAIILLLLPLPVTVKSVALFMIGLGNGPTFPNLIYYTPKFFGQEVSQSITGTILAFCNAGILVMPLVFGYLAQNVSITLFPITLAVLFVLMLVFTIIYLKMPKPKAEDFE